MNVTWRGWQASSYGFYWFLVRKRRRNCFSYTEMFSKKL